MIIVEAIFTFCVAVGVLGSGILLLADIDKTFARAALAVFALTFGVLQIVFQSLALTGARGWVLTDAVFSFISYAAILVVGVTFVWDGWRTDSAKELVWGLLTFLLPAVWGLALQASLL